MSKKNSLFEDAETILSTGEGKGDHGCKLTHSSWPPCRGSRHHDQGSRFDGQATRDTFFRDEIKDLKEKGLYRELRTIEGEQDSSVIIDGKRVLMFSSNNYLGLANHPGLKKASMDATSCYGTGSGASRLISGNMRIHRALENELALFKGTDRALLFSSGYHANLGVISALAGEGDLILSDELNHASIIDGCRLSRAEVRVYKHANMSSLEEVLKRSSIFKNRLIITDSVFSMDGDIAPLHDIIDLAEKYSARVMVDDAHGTGVLGEKGTGAIEHFGLEGRVEIQMGTLGKALGSFGAYIAGSEDLIQYLVNKARSLLYTTALPPSVCGATLAALKILGERPDLISQLRNNTIYFRKRMMDLGYLIPAGETPIVPLVVGNPSVTMEMAQTLLDEGVYVQGIRPPTVPDGTSRLRITLMASHTKEQLDFCLRAFEKIGKKWIIKGKKSLRI
jgi:8-amino-7-oxononanoate synthase